MSNRTANCTAFYVKESFNENNDLAKLPIMVNPSVHPDFALCLP